MENRLPYKLTEGVTATREGLRFEDEGLFCYVAEIGSQKELDQARTERHFGFDYPVLTWPDAAERLRYREGEPACFTHDLFPTAITLFHKTKQDVSQFEGQVLHRLAAILCDDAEAFRVLHWCINHLPETNNDDSR